jgi:hypothetical protein
VFEQGKTYEYIRMKDSEGIQHQQMKERMKKEDTRRLRMILNCELHDKNKIIAIGD